MVQFPYCSCHVLLCQSFFLSWGCLRGEKEKKEACTWRGDLSAHVFVLSRGRDVSERGTTRILFALFLSISGSVSCYRTSFRRCLCFCHIWRGLLIGLTFFLLSAIMFPSLTPDALGAPSGFPRAGPPKWGRSKQHLRGTLVQPAILQLYRNAS